MPPHHLKRHHLRLDSALEGQRKPDLSFPLLPSQMRVLKHEPRGEKETPSNKSHRNSHRILPAAIVNAPNFIPIHVEGFQMFTLPRALAEVGQHVSGDSYQR